MPDRCSPCVESLYIHVPFCSQKCAYCAFYSEAASGELVNRYTDALVLELQLVAEDLCPRTVFFGGGTPSLLNLRQWEQIFRAMERLRLLGAEEWTVECNPATISYDKARLLRDFGVNRVSMGVQSLDPALLERLGRIHSREMVFKSFDILRHAGFDNVNLDLMFAIPGQTRNVWRATLNEALALGSEHLSTYEVIYEEDTPLFARLQAGEFDVDEDLACAMYEELVERASAAGFQQYEVANFARPGAGEPPRAAGIEQRTSNSHCPAADIKSVSRGVMERHMVAVPSCLAPAHACRHNVNYWRGGSFYGLGPSATSYVRGVRTRNRANTQIYCEQLETGKRAIESIEELSPLARAGETAAFGLRMVAGWSLSEFREITGYDLCREWSSEIDRLVGQGWGRLDSDRFHLTSAGLRFADAAAELFLK